jgi:uncharacterized membrane protein YtjA (UPF0391 family)
MERSKAARLRLSAIERRNLFHTYSFFMRYKEGVRKMLYYAVVFLVIALVAGLLGFGGIAGASAGIAQILFFVFLALLVLSLIAGLFRRA